MEAMRDKWSDERMDDLNRRVENGFNRVDADLREIRAEIGGLRGETKSEIGGLRGEIGSLRSELHTEIGSLHRLILQVAGGMFATFAIGFAGLIATRL
jgi:hypothetical protein